MLIIVLLSIIIGADLAVAEPAKLLAIHGETIGDSTMVTLDFDNQLTWQDVEIRGHELFIEVKLPQTSAENISELQAIDSPYVLKLLPLQLHSETAALRMFVKQRGHLVQQATVSEIAGRQLFITVDHQQLQQLLHEDQQAKTLFGKIGVIEMARWLGIIMIISLSCLFFFYWLKRARYWRFSLGNRRRKEKKSQLQVIEQLVLATKHKLALVKVQDQQMLFGVTTEGIQLLAYPEPPQPTGLPLEPKNSSVTTIVSNEPPTQPTTNDTLLNQNSLSAQKSMQRSQYFRDTLARPAPINGKKTDNSKQKGITEMNNMLRAKLTNLPPR